jgi:hypothetical protein
MSAWTADEIDRLGRAEEVEVASRRRDGTLTPFITIWAARLDEDLYVRSAYGPDNGWYRRAKAAGSGRLRAAGIERDVDFVEPDHAVDAGLTRAYHAKYDRHGQAIVGTVVSDDAERSTLRVVPR